MSANPNAARRAEGTDIPAADSAAPSLNLTAEEEEFYRRGLAEEAEGREPSAAETEPAAAEAEKAKPETKGGFFGRLYGRMFRHGDEAVAKVDAELTEIAEKGAGAEPGQPNAEELSEIAKIRRRVYDAANRLKTADITKSGSPAEQRDALYRLYQEWNWEQSKKGRKNEYSKEVNDLYRKLYKKGAIYGGGKYTNISEEENELLKEAEGRNLTDLEVRQMMTGERPWQISAYQRADELLRLEIQAEEDARNGRGQPSQGSGRSGAAAVAAGAALAAVAGSVLAGANPDKGRKTPDRSVSIDHESALADLKGEIEKTDSELKELEAERQKMSADLEELAKLRGQDSEPYRTRVTRLLNGLELIAAYAVKAQGLTEEGRAKRHDAETYASTVMGELGQIGDIHEDDEAQLAEAFARLSVRYDESLKGIQKAFEENKARRAAAEAGRAELDRSVAEAEIGWAQAAFPEKGRRLDEIKKEVADLEAAASRRTEIGRAPLDMQIADLLEEAQKIKKELLERLHSEKIKDKGFGAVDKIAEQGRLEREAALAEREAARELQRAYDRVEIAALKAVAERLPQADLAAPPQTAEAAAAELAALGASKADLDRLNAKQINEIFAEAWSASLRVDNVMTRAHKRLEYLPLAAKPVSREEQDADLAVLQSEAAPAELAKLFRKYLGLHAEACAVLDKEDSAIIKDELAEALAKHLAETEPPPPPPPDASKDAVPAETPEHKRAMDFVAKKRERIMAENLADAGYTAERAKAGLAKAEEVAAYDSAPKMADALIGGEYLHKGDRNRLTPEELKAIVDGIVEDFRKIVAAKEAAVKPDAGEPVPAPAPDKGEPKPDAKAERRGHRKSAWEAGLAKIAEREAYIAGDPRPDDIADSEEALKVLSGLTDEAAMRQWLKEAGWLNVSQENALSADDVSEMLGLIESAARRALEKARAKTPAAPAAPAQPPAAKAAPMPAAQPKPPAAVPSPAVAAPPASPDAGPGARDQRAEALLDLMGDHNPFLGQDQVFAKIRVDQAMPLAEVKNAIVAAELAAPEIADQLSDGELEGIRLHLVEANAAYEEKLAEAKAAADGEPVATDKRTGKLFAKFGLEKEMPPSLAKAKLESLKAMVASFNAQETAFRKDKPGLERLRADYVQRVRTEILGLPAAASNEAKEPAVTENATAKLPEAWRRLANDEEGARKNDPTYLMDLLKASMGGNVKSVKAHPDCAELAVITIENPDGSKETLGIPTSDSARNVMDFFDGADGFKPISRIDRAVILDPQSLKPLKRGSLQAG